jgi:hypothetical protein
MLTAWAKRLHAGRRCGLPSGRAPTHNLSKSRGREFQAPIATASLAIQSNEVHLPQEGLHGFSRLGRAANWS